MANTHDNADFAITEKDREVFRRLEGRSTEMLKRRLSTITAGDEQDEVLFERMRGKVSIRQFAPDQDCLRISIGEVNSSNREKYLVFRGDPRRVRKVLQRMVAEMDAVIASGECV